jgi:hypothetical protein
MCNREVFKLCMVNELGALEFNEGIVLVTVWANI